MDSLTDWFTLKAVPGIGNHIYKRLIDAFGSPGEVFAAPRSKLLAVDGVSEKIAAAIAAHSTPETAHKNIDLCRRHGIDVITMTDPAYPTLLREIPDPPPYLYVKGKLTADAACLAIVGSRNPTSYGLSMAGQLGRDLASRGLTVVSGLARGIDTAAHEGALDAGGPTWAVLGSGLANIYPENNKKLAAKIAETGAVISEFPVLAGPDHHHFPVRNRVISGMSTGTVVVEAARKSGSLITARLAAEQGREVFAVPGSIQSFKSTGTHGLLKQGATLVESAADILSEIAHMLSDTRSLPGPGSQSAGATDKTSAAAGLSSEETSLLGLLEPYPAHIDDISRKAAMAPGQTAAVLLNLELKGLIQQEPGNFFLLKEAAIE